MRRVLSLVPLLALVPLSACSLEGFAVEPCMAGDTIGFRIAAIDGWFRDYHPRPESLFVRVNDGRSYEEARVWAARLPFNGTEDSAYGIRPPRSLIIYGEQLAGWEAEQPPEGLSQDQTYYVFISDGGHHGRAVFTLKEPWPAC